MSPPREPSDAFHALDPLTAFRRFGQEEIARIEQTDPTYDASLYEEALALVVARLSGTTRGEGESET